MRKTDDRLSDIIELKDLITDFNIRIDKEARTAFSNLREQFNKLSTQVNVGKDNTDSNLARFTKELENDIPELGNRVKALNDELGQPDFADTTKMDGEARKAVLDKIDEIEKRVKASGDDAERFNRYQDVLKLEPTAF